MLYLILYVYWTGYFRSLLHVCLRFCRLCLWLRIWCRPKWAKWLTFVLMIASLSFDLVPLIAEINFYKFGLWQLPGTLSDFDIILVFDFCFCHNRASWFLFPELIWDWVECVYHSFQPCDCYHVTMSRRYSTDDAIRLRMLFQPPLRKYVFYLYLVERNFHLFSYFSLLFDYYSISINYARFPYDYCSISIVAT